MKTFILVALALLAFAGNSLLNRLALKGEFIDAETFTIIRLFAGAIALQLIVILKTGKGRLPTASFKQDYKAPVSLFLYALCFSVAYVSLDTGTGALILFAVVQVFLLTVNFRNGNRLNKGEWLGVLCAIAGLVVLLLPGASAPDLWGFTLMSCAGIAWGFYTFLGRGSQQALENTTDNFLKTLPLCILLIIWFRPWSDGDTLLYSSYGIGLAIISGAVTSGIGYAIWYQVLPRLSIVQAAVSQLLVPIIAAAAGIVFLGESLTVLFAVSSVLILGGILLIQFAKR